APATTHDNPLSLHDALPISLDSSAASVLANDTDAEGSTLTATKLSDPAHGSLTLNANGTFSYSHDGSETTTDSFTYKTCDNGTTNAPPDPDPNCTATATVTRTEARGEGTPVATSDSATVAEGGTVTALDSTAASVLANDTDAEGNTLTATKLSDPAHGSLTLNANGTFSYSHDGSETATDSFTYKTCDNGTTNGSPDPKCSGTATVSVTVTPVNDAPVANNDSATTNEDTSVDVNVLANDTDVDNANSELRTVSLRNVTGGTAIVLLDGRTVRFSPSPDANGSDGSTFKFTYKANDGALDSASAAI